MIKLTFSLDHSYSGEDLELTFMVYVEGLTPKVECSWSFSPGMDLYARKHVHALHPSTNIILFYPRTGRTKTKVASFF